MSIVPHVASITPKCRHQANTNTKQQQITSTISALMQIPAAISWNIQAGQIKKVGAAILLWRCVTDLEESMVKSVKFIALTRQAKEHVVKIALSDKTTDNDDRPVRLGLGEMSNERKKVEFLFTHDAAIVG